MQFLRNQVFGVLFFFLLCGASVASEAERPIRVLSIDGGGVRGLVAAAVLQQLEKELDKSVAETFDLVAGTSIGGIIALALTAPDETGHPRHSAQDVVNLAFSESTRIFSASIGYQIATLGGLLGPKYESDGLRDVLFASLGRTKLSEALTPVVITGYHVQGESGIEFNSEDARIFSSDKDCLMYQVAMATSAAPTYFDSVDVKFPWGNLNDVADGALYKHTPALLAYANAKQLYPNRTIEVYSLGTGILTAEELTTQLKGRGIFQWLAPIIRHLTIGAGDADHSVLHKLLNENGEENYFRLNIRVDSAHKDMDNSSPDNLSYLYRKGLEITRSANFARVVERLRKTY